MSRQAPQIITFGETMALFMPSEHYSIERSDTLKQGFGGAESNVAIGLARLGVNVGWFSKLGEDPFGSRIVKTVRGEGVDVTRVIYSEQAATGMMFRELISGKVAVHYFRKHSAASTLSVADLDEQYICGAQILHITGITPALSESCREATFKAVEIAKKAGVKISFDPNLRLKLWSIEEARKVILPLAEQADYFLPGWDELKLLYDTTDTNVIDEKLHALNATSIVKGKGDCNVIYENGKQVEVPFYPVEKVVDTVGAGDAFCAGFLAGIAKGLSLVEAVRIASVSGAIVVQMHGDWDALPTWKSVEQRLSTQEWIER